MTSAASAVGRAPVAPGGYDGEMSSLYALETEHRQCDLQSGKTRIDGQEKAEKKAFDDAREALQREEEAESHHGFWSDVENAVGDVAKVAGVVAAAASAVATGGVAVAVLAPVASVATATAGVSTLATAGAHVVSSHYAAQVDRASGDATDGTLRGDRMQTEITSTVDDIRDTEDSHRRVEQTLQGTIATNDRTSLEAAASLRIRG